MREMGQDLARDIRADWTRFGGDRHDPAIANLTPELALLEEVRRSAAMVRFLEERIAMWNLTPESHASIEKVVSESGQPRSRASLRRHIDEVLQGLPAEDPASPAHLPPLTNIHPKTGLSSFTDAREWLLLYREERGHLARTAKMCIDAGVANRLVSLAEDQGRILASAIRAVLMALNLSPEQASLVPSIVPPILRAVANDQPIPSITSLGLPEEITP